jgi:NTE family protein
MKKRPKTALVLGSGAARSLAHIGVLKILEQQRIPIDMIVGSSMGALIGGAYASGLSAAQIEEIACETNWLRVVKILFPKRLQLDGLLDGRRVQKFLLALVGEQKIEELKIPFACAATDINSGEEITLNSGSLINAIRASISFPFLFKPFKINGNYLIDGGVVNPVPVSMAREMGAERVIAVSATPPVHRHVRHLNSGKLVTPQNILAAANSNSFFQRFFRFFNENGFKVDEEDGLSSQPTMKLGIRRQMIQVAMTMENVILNLRLKESPADIFISPDVSKFQFFDFHRANDIISAGEKAMDVCIHDLI